MNCQIVFEDKTKTVRMAEQVLHNGITFNSKCRHL